MAGHHRRWAITQEEQSGSRVVTTARARGYKWNTDDYARRGGFQHDNYGASLLFMIDAKAPPNTRVKPFADLPEGAEFLAWRSSAVSNVRPPRA